MYKRRLKHPQIILQTFRNLSTTYRPHIIRLHSVFSRILRTAILPICISTHDAPDQDYPLRRNTASHRLLLQVLLHTYKLLTRPTAGNNLKYPHVIFQSYPASSGRHSPLQPQLFPPFRLPFMWTRKMEVEEGGLGGFHPLLQSHPCQIWLFFNCLRSNQGIPLQQNSDNRIRPFPRFQRLMRMTMACGNTCTEVRMRERLKKR